MYKLAIILAVAICAVSASPKAAPGLLGAPLAYTAPVAYAAPVAPAVVTAHSSQVIAQNFNGLAPLAAAYAYPAVAHAPAVLLR